MLLGFDDRGHGPSVVLLHGFPLDRSIWDGLLGPLAVAHRLIVPDLRGHGRSPATPGPYPMEDLADDVLETLEAESVPPPYVLVGHSMGGYVALAFAEAHPDRLRALILLSSRASADTPEAAERRLASAETLDREGTTDSLLGMVDTMLATDNRRARPELVEQVGALIRGTPAVGAAGALRGMSARPDRHDVLRALDVPLLVVAGNDDAIVPPEESAAMADAAPDGRLATIPGAGHLAPLEVPGATAGVLLSFLGGLR